MNAHTVTGGTGRKAGYETIVPLCHRCHDWYDLHQREFACEEIRDRIKAYAVTTEQAWQAYTVHQRNAAK